MSSPTRYTFIVRLVTAHACYRDKVIAPDGFSAFQESLRRWPPPATPCAISVQSRPFTSKEPS